MSAEAINHSGRPYCGEGGDVGVFSGNGLKEDARTLVLATVGIVEPHGGGSRLPVPIVAKETLSI